MTKLLLLTIALAAPLGAQPTPPATSISARPAELFERDWVLMNWALKFFDRDGDMLLSPVEARAAADDFRRIADSDQDGRVTVLEYRRAREFILARH